MLCNTNNEATGVTDLGQWHSGIDVRPLLHGPSQRPSAFLAPASLAGLREGVKGYQRAG